MGAFQGTFKNVAATELGSAAIKGALERACVAAEGVDEVLMGCVLPAGLGQAPARQASRGAGVKDSVGCTTLNKVCGSGMKTVMMAHDMLKTGNGDVIVAGGMESMTCAPYLLDKARGGMRLGHGKIKDHMFTDGLEDAYEGNLMGHFADQMAAKYNFTREDQDAFAIKSLKRAKEAHEGGVFKDEITPVVYTSRKLEVRVVEDETPLSGNPDKVSKLRPAFNKDGTVTAANASSIADGAAAMVLMRESDALAKGLKPLARIKGHASFGRLPSEFTIAPVGAMQKLSEQTGWDLKDVDLFEINEAFAMVTMAAMKDLNLPHDKVNVHGGACALGHPLGATGARILVTLLYALEKHNLKRGVAALCIGGGEATAIAVERM